MNYCSNCGSILNDAVEGSALEVRKELSDYILREFENVGKIIIKGNSVILRGSTIHASKSKAPFKRILDLGFEITKIEGSLVITGNVTSLVGAPEVVTGYLTIVDCPLKSLKGCPQTVEGFSCTRTLITSLEGAPTNVLGTEDYNVSSNKLYDLKGSPETVKGNFIANSNRLDSLVGSPKVVFGDFSVSENNLKSLAGGPTVVHHLYIADNNVIKELDSFNTKTYELLLDVQAKRDLRLTRNSLVGKHKTRIR